MNAVLKGRPQVAAEVRDEEMDYNPTPRYEAPPVPQELKQELTAVAANASDDTYSYFDSLANEEF